MKTPIRPKDGVRHRSALRSALSIAAALGFGAASSASGAITISSSGGLDTVKFEFDTIIDGGQAPSGGSPYLTTTFTDLADGKVRLTIDPTGFSGTDTLDKLNFNFDPSLIGSLTFTEFSRSGTFGSVTITSGNSINAGAGARTFEIDFDFPNPAAQRFTAFDQLVVDISFAPSNASFGAMSFADLSDIAPIDTAYAVAHVISLQDGGGSVKITPGMSLVPEPGSMAGLMGLLAGGAFLRSRRRPTA
jgi:hypothetical protein